MIARDDPAHRHRPRGDRRRRPGVVGVRLHEAARRRALSPRAGRGPGRGGGAVRGGHLVHPAARRARPRDTRRPPPRFTWTGHAPRGIPRGRRRRGDRAPSLGGGRAGRRRTAPGLARTRRSRSCIRVAWAACSSSWCRNAEGGRSLCVGDGGGGRRRSHPVRFAGETSEPGRCRAGSWRRTRRRGRPRRASASRKPVSMCEPARSWACTTARAKTSRSSSSGAPWPGVGRGRPRRPVRWPGSPWTPCPSRWSRSSAIASGMSPAERNPSIARRPAQATRTFASA